MRKKRLIIGLAAGLPALAAGMVMAFWSFGNPAFAQNLPQREPQPLSISRPWICPSPPRGYPGCNVVCTPRSYACPDCRLECPFYGSSSYFCDARNYPPAPQGCSYSCQSVYGRCTCNLSCKQPPATDRFPPCPVYPPPPSGCSLACRPITQAERNSGVCPTCELRCPVAGSSSSAPQGCFCPQVYAPVCGQDGRTYSNSCFAGCAGAEVAYSGACSAGYYSSSPPLFSCRAFGRCRFGESCPAGTACSGFPAYGCYPLHCPAPL